MSKYRTVTLIAASILCLCPAAPWQAVLGQEKGIKYASERSPFPFIGATMVALEGFDPKDKDPKSALLQLDKNQIFYSSFGEPRLTAVFYKPVPVTLTPLNIADPSGQNRRIFAVDLPKENAADLGKSTLRLVTSIGKKSELAGIRLLLVNQEDKVTQVLELRATSN